MSTYDALRSILACLLLQLEKDARPVGKGCASIVVPGQGLIRIGMGKGRDQAWVRLRSSYAATIPGRPEPDPQQCAQFLGLSVEVGVIRCFTLPSNGREVSAEKTQDSALVQLQDMESIRTALLECGVVSDKDDRLLGNYVPLGPAGPDLGGYWTFDLVLTPWE